MEISRARFAKDIVVEFVPPARPTKKDRVIILCSGLPTSPNKNKQLEFFSKKGFWVIFPRYRGTWESDGKFLEISPEKDILDIINNLHKPITSIWDNQKYRLNPSKIFILGASFGGPAAILGSLSPKVTKIVAVSPVIDWREDSKEEPMPLLKKLTREAFGHAYRFTDKRWDELAKGKFYNPIDQQNKINGDKILLIHAKNDTMCPYRATKKFADATGSKLVTLPKGGHLGTTLLTKPRFYNIFKKFIKN